MKKTIIIIVVALLAVAAIVAGFMFLKKDNIEYVEFVNDYAGFKAKAGLPKDADFEFIKGDDKYRGEFYNEEEEYKIRIALRSDNMKLYENNQNLAKEKDGYEEFETKHAKVYGYTSTSYTKTFRFILGEKKEEGRFYVVQVEVARTGNHSKGADSLMEFKEVKAFLNSVQLVETYDLEEEVEEKEEVKEEVKEEEKEEKSEE